jgi:small conductance mechanosensitive channel
MEPQSVTDLVVASRAAASTLTALAVQYSLSVIGAVVLLVAGWLASRFLHRWALAGMQRVRGFDVTLAHFLANVVRYAVLILVLVMVLGQFGVQTASIIAAMGAAGLAIGLALQGTLQNIAAGIMLLVLRPFRVGEAIETKDLSGTIVEIGLFATEVKTFDGLLVTAPNSLLWNTPVKNFSRFLTRRADVIVVLPVTADVRQAEATLYSLASEDGRVRSDPAPIVIVSDVTPDTVKLTLMAWFDSANFGEGSRALQKAAKIALGDIRKNAMSMMPQMVVSLPKAAEASRPLDSQRR